MVKKLLIGMTVTAALLAACAAAEEAAASLYDKIWDVPKWVDNDGAAVLQSLALTGRLQGEYAYFDSDDHGDFEDALWRRFRAGAKAKLFNGFTVHAEADLDLNNAGSASLYKRLTDAYVKWNLSKAFALKVGKQSAGFTLDGATSSKKLLTLERSMVAGNLWFTDEYFTGVSASGTVDGWTYTLAGFSAEDDEEFAGVDCGWFSLASIGRDVSENTSLRLDYVHNEADYSEEAGTKKLSDVVSLVSQSEFGDVGLRTDLSCARGEEGQSDLIGLQIMPYYNFNETWQGVFSYAMVHATDGPGAKMGRYPKKKLSGSAYETVHEFFAGVNCYLYGHKLKWQTGVEYNLAQDDSAGDNYNGWGATTGFRISW